jgi:hypothetical protein
MSRQGFHHVSVDLPVEFSLFTAKYEHCRGRDDDIAVAPDAVATLAAPSVSTV